MIGKMHKAIATAMTLGAGLVSATEQSSPGGREITPAEASGVMARATYDWVVGADTPTVSVAELKEAYQQAGFVVTD